MHKRGEQGRRALLAWRQRLVTLQRGLIETSRRRYRVRRLFEPREVIDVRAWSIRRAQPEVSEEHGRERWIRRGPAFPDRGLRLRRR